MIVALSQIGTKDADYLSMNSAKVMLNLQHQMEKLVNSLVNNNFLNPVIIMVHRKNWR